MPDRFKVVAVTDPIEERRRQATDELGSTAYETFDAMLADPQVEMVVVASPNPFHCKQAIAALNAGKHVLCEKPFGLTVADVDAMIAASERAGRMLQPFQQRRFEPDFRKVKEICDSGLIGTIQFVRICWHGFKRRWDWQTLTSMAGGALNNNGPHPIDHALELFGNAEPEVWCDMRRVLCSGDAEDHLKIILRAPGCPTVEIELMDDMVFGQDRWLVCGSSGGLRGHAGALEWKWVDWSTMPPRTPDPKPTPDRSYNSEKLQWNTDQWKPDIAPDAGSGAAPAPQPVLDMYQTIWETIRLGRPQVITPRQVRTRLVVLEKARNASGYYPAGSQVSVSR
jgi:predicted dehydrogenase